MWGKNNPLSRVKVMEKTRLINDTSLEWSEKDFTITIIKVLKELMEQVDNMNEQMENFSRKMDTAGNIQMKMLEIKGNIVLSF